MSVPSYELPVGVVADERGTYENYARLVNMVQAALRECGAEHLARALRTGGVVLVKPNLVVDHAPPGSSLAGLVTQGPLVGAVLDVCRPILDRAQRVIVGDAPLQTTDFDAVVQEIGLERVVERWRRRREAPALEIIDFRQTRATRDERGHIRGWQESPGDPSGVVAFDLGAESLLEPIAKPGVCFRVSNYPAVETARYHRRGSHRYVVARSALEASLILNLPKMKTHCKVGVTLGLKNMVGLVGRKQCLAHHRQGGTAGGGDEYPGASALKALSTRLEDAIDGRRPGMTREALKLAYRANERLIRLLRLNPIRDGSWYGNDTCWRMALDLNRILLYGRPDGTLADTPQRAILTVVDGVVAGEGEGPLAAKPKSCGLVVAGTNPVLTDIVTATLMGFDYQKIPLLREALKISRWPLAPAGLAQCAAEGAPERVTLFANGEPMTLKELAGSRFRQDFLAAQGWRGHIELS